MIKNKCGESFNLALIVILLSITLTSIAFISERNDADGITGFAVSADSRTSDSFVAQTYLREFNDFDSLRSLAAGNYYVDDNGIVYWIDDESKPAIAKVNFIDQEHKKRIIYIDNEGNIGYPLPKT